MLLAALGSYSFISSSQHCCEVKTTTILIFQAKKPESREVEQLIQSYTAGKVAKWGFELRQSDSRGLALNHFTTQCLLRPASGGSRFSHVYSELSFKDQARWQVSLGSIAFLEPTSTAILTWLLLTIRHWRFPGHTTGPASPRH